MALDAKTPAGPLKDKWQNYLANTKLINPANRKKLDIIVVGAGLAGGGAAASLAELGYNVKVFCLSGQRKEGSLCGSAGRSECGQEL